MEISGDIGRIEEGESEKKARLQELWLRAANENMGIEQPLMIGDSPVDDGVTFEQVREELLRLMDEGYIKFNSSYRPYLTDKGLEALASL